RSVRERAGDPRGARRPPRARDPGAAAREAAAGDQPGEARAARAARHGQAHLRHPVRRQAMTRAPRPTCAVSVDLDGIACYYRIHGLGLPPPELEHVILERALPRAARPSASRPTTNQVTRSPRRLIARRAPATRCGCARSPIMAT